MNVREHAYSARALQDACGGVDACLALLQRTPFAMRQTHLYDCRDPNSRRTMPIGAVAFLERHQNWRFYSLKMFRQLDNVTAPEGSAPDLQLEAIEALEDAVQVQRRARLAAARGFTENGFREIEEAMQAVEVRFARIRAAMDSTVLQAVAA